MEVSMTVSWDNTLIAQITPSNATGSCPLQGCGPWKRRFSSPRVARRHTIMPSPITV